MTHSQLTDQPIPTYPWLKWFVDKLITLTLLGLFSPILLVVVVGMAVTMVCRPQDRGPWFYRERRISRGREFDVLKFRVLRVEVLARGEREGKHARLYEGEVENLTWAGRYLLKSWYFDELPQLFNILKGDMSLVGPRPWPVHMVEEQARQGIFYRQLIQAGWTGPAQLQKGFPSGLRPEQLDLAYLARCVTWSPGELVKYDLQVLYQTLLVMLKGQGLQF